MFRARFSEQRAIPPQPWAQCHLCFLNQTVTEADKQGVDNAEMLAEVCYLYDDGSVIAQYVLFRMNRRRVNTCKAHLNASIFVKSLLRL